MITPGKEAKNAAERLRLEGRLLVDDIEEDQAVADIIQSAIYSDRSNHADKLAEALRDIIARLSQPVCFSDGSVTPKFQILQGDFAIARNTASTALAAYEKAGRQ